MMAFDYNNKDAFRLSNFVNSANLKKNATALSGTTKKKQNKKTIIIIITTPLSILKVFYINIF